MTLSFFKYQATGNDFVILDNRKGMHAFSKPQIEKICDRKFGVGADGLILIEQDADHDFNLVYYNNDGSQSLCGNGSRAAVSFAASLGIVNGRTSFNAYDGQHDAELLPSGIVRLKMNDVGRIQEIENDFFVNTGSPHYVKVVDDLPTYPVFDEGTKIRHLDQFSPAGTNVNFIQLQNDNTLFVRTFERGVEDETLSCGTGVTAAALVASLKGYKSPVNIQTTGGDLSVEFKSGQSGTFTDIFLVGPAKMVFKGELEL